MTDLRGRRIGCAMTGSFCTFEKAFSALEALREAGAELFPIFSENAYQTDTRFGPAGEMRARAEAICGREIWHTLGQVEPIGPKRLLDLLVIAPCTGTTLGKLANGIADTAVTMAAKSHLRNGRPVLIGISTNDALGRSARNIGALLDMKHIYFMPFAQDDFEKKPNSLVASLSEICDAARCALEERQIQPLLRMNSKL